MTEAWRLLKPETLTDKVYEILRERVISGKISPGEFIREHDVSEKLGVSRTPVRESETVDDLIEIYPIMTALEVLGTTEAFDQLDATEIAELRKINDAYAKAFEAKDVYVGIDKNHEFHAKLSARSGNKRLCRMLEDLRSRVRSLEIWAFSDIEHWQKSIDQHEEILKAVEARRLDKAIEILNNNRLGTYREFTSQTESQEQST